MTRTLIYDCETLPNYWLCRVMDFETGARVSFEISERCDDLADFREFWSRCKSEGWLMVGFNSLWYDYPLCEWMYVNKYKPMTNDAIYKRSQDLINGDSKNWQFPSGQCDLFRMMHFDNQSKSCGLKKLQASMRLPLILDFDHQWDQELDLERFDDCEWYCDYDVTSTADFLSKTDVQSNLKLRQSLVEILGPGCLSYSDSKVGEELFKHYLNEAGVKIPKPAAAPDFFSIGDCIFPDVAAYPFKAKAFIEARAKFLRTHVRAGNLKGVLSFEVPHNGVDFSFGLGGLHASVSRQRFIANEDYCLIDLDVSSYYPNIAIQNNLYPGSLGEIFCTIYRHIYEQRIASKDEAIKYALKIALNAVYGKSNYENSFLYDPTYTAKTTVNGQLMLLMLIDMVEELVPGAVMAQANTDGITYWLRREDRIKIQAAADNWMAATRMELKLVEFDYILIRDVNAFIAKETNGKTKGKGAYEVERAWHKIGAPLAPRKAAIEHMLTGKPVEECLYANTDPYDFMHYAQAPAGCSLLHDGVDLGRRIRYAVSVHGSELIKRMPPQFIEGAYKLKAGVKEHPADPFKWSEAHHTKRKSKYEWRELGVEAGQKVIDCRDVRNLDVETFFNHLNYEYYINKARDLVI